MQYRRGKKRRNSLNWLCFTAMQSEDSSTQWLHHLMISRQSSHSMTSCPQQITVPFAVCIFGGFGETRHATSKLDDSPQHRNISCNAKQFNVQIERLMFYKVIRHNATPFVCTLYHSTLRWAISHISTPFVCTLYHSTLRWAIPRNATLFVCTLCHSYYAELFHATLHRLCVRCATRHYPVPFDATLHRLCTVLQMSAKLFAIELVHFTISCSNST